MKPARQKRGKLWRHLKTYYRADVQQAATSLRLEPEAFRMMGIREWQWVERRVQQRFYTRPYALRQPFPFTCIRADAWVQADLIHGLIDAMAPGETRCYSALGNEAHKQWWCEGSYEATIAVFSKICQANDLLLVPQSFHWLVTVTHHGDLYAVGEPVSSRLVDRGATRLRDTYSPDQLR